MLQGGQSGLNLTSGDANTGLRILSNSPTLGPIANEMRQTGGVADPTNFYALQNGLRGLKQQGAIGGGQAVSQAPAVTQPAMSAAIRNPSSYAATVSRNQAMVSQAVTQAPTEALAMTAHQLGASSSPEAKQMAVDAVMKAANDPATKAYVKTYLQPLVSYGK